MELLLGALAEAIITVLIEDLSQRPRLAALRDKLRGDSPEKLALQYALAQSYRAFIDQYPQLAHAFFDEHFLKQPAVASELANLLTPQRTPDASTLVQLWRAQFPSPPTIEIAAEIQFFLATLADAIKSQPALKPFTDSRAFEQLYLIAERAERQIDEQQTTNEHLTAIHRLLTEVTSRLSAQPTQLQIQSGGGAVLQGNANAGQDVVLRDKVTNVYHFYGESTSATTTKQPSIPDFVPLTNPFTSRGRINEPHLFFGRQRILRELQQALTNGNSIALIGASETGKSSLLSYLYHMRQDWLPSHAVIYLDLQGVIDEIDFCTEILQVLDPLKQGKQRTGKEALRALKQAMRGRKVLLLMDEVERLYT
ncbi:MAG: ATP-binding protein [Caldilinea sp. CFX5]|nr:ATP-binding protein [Caldilinea sp. CFX5]